MLRIEDVGELVYGGAVTGAEWWDEKRISEGKLAAGDFWKKYSTYTYLGVGLIAIGMNAFGWMRKYSTWSEHISHGFIYGLPGFARAAIKSMGTSRSASGSSAAVAQAQAILAARRQAAAQLGAGQPIARTYEKEFQSTGVL